MDQGVQAVRFLPVDSSELQSWCGLGSWGKHPPCHYDMQQHQNYIIPIFLGWFTYIQHKTWMLQLWRGIEDGSFEDVYELIYILSLDDLIAASWFKNRSFWQTPLCFSFFPPFRITFADSKNVGPVGPGKMPLTCYMDSSIQSRKSPEIRKYATAVRLLEHVKGEGLEGW